MLKVKVIGFETLTSEKGKFTKVYAVSEAPNPRGTGHKAVECFVDSYHLRKHNITPDNLVGKIGDYYNVKDGNRWKSGITFKNSN